MKRLITIGMAALMLGIGGVAAAQTSTMTNSHMNPNGSVHTTTRTETPVGTATTRTVDRADGTRVVRTRVRESDSVGMHHGHHYGWSHNRVCTTHWRHHHRVRTCTTRHWDR
ncbi:MAG TPA: hypothetical protein VLM18_09795 [Croceibacterium sp.]|nr:hypothetical protein [Croceibacterium sp.]